MNEQTTSVNSEKTTQERIDAGENHIHFYEQVIFVKNKPDIKCNKCLGLGYLGTWRQKPQPKLPIGRNNKCPCGSEKKYKKCCIQLANRMRHSGASILTCGCVGKATMADNPELKQLRQQMDKLNKSI